MEGTGAHPRKELVDGGATRLVCPNLLPMTRGGRSASLAFGGSHLPPLARTIVMNNFQDRRLKTLHDSQTLFGARVEHWFRFIYPSLPATPHTSRMQSVDSMKVRKRRQVLKQKYVRASDLKDPCSKDFDNWENHLRGWATFARLSFFGCRRSCFGGIGERGWVVMKRSPRCLDTGALCWRLWYLQNHGIDCRPCERFLGFVTATWIRNPCNKPCKINSDDRLQCYEDELVVQILRRQNLNLSNPVQVFKDAVCSRVVYDSTISETNKTSADGAVPLQKKPSG